MRRRPEDKGSLDRRLELAGWGLWLLALALFIVSGVRNGDPWTVAGSIIFVVGIVLFLLPMFRRTDE